MAQKQTCDVIVVGAGTAAFEAAVAARQQGAERVIMLEKASEAEAGGNSRYTGTGFRFVHGGAAELRDFVADDEAAISRMHIPPYEAERFRGDLQRVTQGRINQRLADILVEQSNAGLHWMLDSGVKFQLPETRRVVDGITYFEPGCALQALGGQGQQFQQWLTLRHAKGVELRLQSWVSALLGNARQVQGVLVSTPDGDYELEARATILCAGGFQSDPEKRSRYLGTNADLMKVRGSAHDTGEVLMMALELGAQASGQWQGAHASPIDANAPNVNGGEAISRYSYVFGISVNMLGERFFDEGEAESVYTYAKTGRRILDQPGGNAFQIYDQQVAPYMRRQYADASVFEAATLASLAEKIGLEPALLEKTVAEFNAATHDDVPFNPRGRDGKSTRGIFPPKSNWALPIKEPPFRAYPVTGGITFTFGGLAVSEEAQVLNKTGQPIRGLYASGDILGLFFFNYPSFSGQTRNVVFSRLAAKHATQTGGGS